MHHVNEGPHKVTVQTCVCVYTCTCNIVRTKCYKPQNEDIFGKWVHFGFFETICSDIRFRLGEGVS